MEQEIWKDIKGYEGKYQVSNLGRVKSLCGWNVNNGYVKREKILSNTLNKKSGRVSVMLCDGAEKRKRISVHRLVALAFIPNPKNKPEVNHKDENPQNNIVDNLEWCTRKYNMNYGTTPQRLNIKNKKPVIGEKDGKIIKFNSVREGKSKGFDSSGIIRSAKKGIKYKGYLWRYAND